MSSSMAEIISFLNDKNNSFTIFIILLIIIFGLATIFILIGKFLNKKGAKTLKFGFGKGFIEIVKNDSKEDGEKTVNCENDSNKQNLIENQTVINANKKLIPFKDHEFFSNMRKYENIPLFSKLYDSKSNYSDYFKFKMFLLDAYIRKCKINIFRKNIETFVKLVETTNGEHINNILTILYDSIAEYEGVAEKLRIELPNGTVIFGIPHEMIREFNKWHSPKVEATVEKISDILKSSFHNSWQLKLIMILGYLDFVFAYTIKDSILTLESLNGTLEKKLEKYYKPMYDK